MSTPLKPANDAWAAPEWVAYYEDRRATTAEIYPSEWLFLKDLLAEGISVLDIGCATGGLSAVLAEHLDSFQYTGVDVNPGMITRAESKHPSHSFYVVGDADLSSLGGARFDLVVCLGVLHLTKHWRRLMEQAWSRAKKHLLVDLRESSAPTIEDDAVSYYSVDALFGSASRTRLPYNVINCSEALSAVSSACRDAERLQHFGYLAAVSSAAVTPVKQILMNTYRIDRASAPNT